MAVVLRSNSDLAYLPDHGFVGEDGGESAMPFNDSKTLHE
jgi:hypothetical protein